MGVALRSRVHNIPVYHSRFFFLFSSNRYILTQFVCARRQLETRRGALDPTAALITGRSRSARYAVQTYAQWWPNWAIRNVSALSFELLVQPFANAFASCPRHEDTALYARRVKRHVFRKIILNTISERRPHRHDNLI